MAGTVDPKAMLFLLWTWSYQLPARLALNHSFHLSNMNRASALLVVAISCTGHAYANNAINVNTNTQNGKHVEEAITEWGSDWYYAICSVMGAAAIGILGASFLKPRSDRVFFYLCAAICTTACIAYYAMGSNLGWTPIDNEWVRNIPGVDGRNREIFYARYIDWYVPGSATSLCLI